MRAYGTVILIVAFTMAVIGPMLWYNKKSSNPNNVYKFVIKTNSLAWKCKPIELGPTAKTILATTNLINCDFIGPRGSRITVFAAKWDESDSNDLGVLLHKPNVCWVAAGWQMVQADFKKNLKINFGSVPILFELGVFRSPQGGFTEIAVWCILVNGVPYQSEDIEFAWFDYTPEHSSGHEGVLRKTKTSYFINSINSRTAASSSKEIIRISTEADGSTIKNRVEFDDFIKTCIYLENL